MLVRGRATKVDAKAALAMPDPSLVADLVQRIRSVVQPERIILFGSAARGEWGPNSDLDVLVVVPNGTGPEDIETQIYLNLDGFGWPVDVVAVTHDELSRLSGNFSLVYFWALREGQLLYAA